MATPTVTAIDIGSGPSGTMVVITGSSFDDSVTKVEFGTYSAGDNYLVSSETEIVAYVPEGTGSSLAVKVTNADGTGTLSSAWTYDTYEGGPGGGGGSAPVVSDVVPDTSAYDDGRGGDAIEITGTGFTTAKFVYFDEVPVEFTINSDTSISTVAPPQGTVGSYVVEVDVENDYGRSADPGSANDFTYPSFDVPAITQAISPQAGIAGQLVTIVGTSFDTATAVTFGTYGAVFEIDATNPTTTIRAWAPYGPTGTVNVTVTNPAGTSPEPGTATWNDFAYAGTVTGLTATPMANAVQLVWNPVAYLGAVPVSYRVYVGATSDPSTLIATTSQTSLVYPLDHDDGLYYFAVSWVDSQGNESAKCTAVSATALENAADIISDGAISSMEMFANQILPPRIVDDLPALPNAEYPPDTMVFLTTNWRLYRNSASGHNDDANVTTRGTWADLVGTNNGTLTNFDWDADSGWKGTGFGSDLYRLTFDGSDNYVPLTSAIDFSDKTGTIEGWFMGSTAATGMIAFIGNTAGTQYCYVGVNTNGYGVAGYKDGTTNYLAYVAEQANIFDSRWHHFVTVINGTSLSLYTDGVLAKTTTVSAGSLTCDKTSLGRSEYASPSSYLNGSLATVRFYSSALAAADIVQNFNAGPTGVGYVSSNLVAHYAAEKAVETSEIWMPLITTDGAAGVIRGNEIMGNSITAGAIAAGAIGAQEIAAQTIGAREIFIGNLDNLVPNPMSEIDHTGRDTAQTSADVDFRGVQSSYGVYEGSHARYLTGAGVGTATEMIVTPRIPVKAGEEYYFRCHGKLYTASGSGVVKARCFQADGVTEVSLTATTDAIDDATWTEYEIKDGSSNPWFTIPGTPGSATAAQFMEVLLYTNNLSTSNYLLVDAMFLRRKNEGRLIVDGSITADHIEAGTITGDQIHADVALSSPVITGGTITGSTIKTASTGKRIEMQSGTYCDTIYFYGDTQSYLDNAAFIMATNAALNSRLLLQGPDSNATDAAYLELKLRSDDSSDFNLVASTQGYVASGGSSLTLTSTGIAAVGDITFDGVITPPTYSAGVDNGTFIQDADDTTRKVKIYFSSGTNKRLYFMHGSTDNYGYLDLTELDGHVDAAVAFTGSW